ncbi:CoA-binding protein [Nibrella saemangeumensis]|uniref:CoA-binding protein n=1 Tax=Nibrella saemangeumensis TaxID=1084526 RepID=A0ABP8N0L6_9BACT
MSEKRNKTLVIGASEKPDRFAFRAANSLLRHGHDIELIGLRSGQIQGHPIQTGLPDLEDIDTVTMYVGARNQGPYYDYLKKLKPRRVIFNPGAENPDLERQLQKEGIQPIEACTLVMLAVGNY